MIRHRYRRIVWFFARLLISFAFWDLIFPRVGLRKIARQTRPERLRKGAIAFRGLAVELGGVMIKVGQFLSTRVDVLPKEITGELAGLQDEVPPESFPTIKQLAEAELGCTLEEKYAAFETQPLAAASLGQVHRARLCGRGTGLAETRREETRLEETALPETGLSQDPAGGDLGPPDWDVVVKIQRPNIESLIETDLAALRTVGNWLKRYRPVRRRADVPALLAEFTKILYEEIDYLAEGRNAEAFGANFRNDPGVCVPSVIWTHTTRRVLTLQNVWAIKITDYDAITAAGISRAEVADRLFDTYLKQIFEDGFFHADPHPGNLFLRPLPYPAESENGRPWQLTFVDFGMAGRVTGETKKGLREMVVGVGTRDAARVVRSYSMLGMVLPTANLDLLEQAETEIFQRFWGKNMSELQQISPQQVAEFAGQFRELVYTLPFQVPHDIIYLARAVGILSGMCTGLDPQFNVWESLAPYARKLVSEEASTGREYWLEEVRTLARSLLTVPTKMDRILSRIESGDVSVRAPEVSRQVSRLETAIRRVTAAILFSALLLGGIQLYLGGQVVFGQILMAGAGVCLLGMILARPKGP
jgi:predicted unusual protein kinase regulating ubiquinone biosynthesis (AarF/ABC1/UbiB family)